VHQSVGWDEFQLVHGVWPQVVDGKTCLTLQLGVSNEDCMMTSGQGHRVGWDIGALSQQGVFLDEDGTIYPKLSRSHAGDLEAVQASAMSFQGNPSIWAWDRKKMDSKSK